MGFLSEGPRTPAEVAEVRRVVRRLRVFGAAFLAASVIVGLSMLVVWLKTSWSPEVHEGQYFLIPFALLAAGVTAWIASGRVEKDL